MIPESQVCINDINWKELQRKKKKFETEKKTSDTKSFIPSKNSRNKNW